MKTSRVSLSDLRALAAFRYELRCFLAFSEQAARAAGIEPQQHQLLLAVGGLPAGQRPNIRTLAQRLCVQHHTAVALVDKLEERALVRRERSSKDKREVLVRLSPSGAELLQQLSRQHRTQLQSVGPEMLAALASILDGRGWTGSGPQRRTRQARPKRLKNAAHSRSGLGPPLSDRSPLQPPLPLR